MGHSEIYARKNRNYLEICLEKSKFFENLIGKIDFFLPESTTPQISNQIDAAGCQQYHSHSLTTDWKATDCRSNDHQKQHGFQKVKQRKKTQLPISNR